MPKWYEKYLSSNAIMHFLNLSGIESEEGNLHWPSVAILAPNNTPFSVSKTVAVGLLKVGFGIRKRENKSRINNPAKVYLDIFKSLLFIQFECMLLSRSNHFNPFPCLPGKNFIIIHRFCRNSRKIIFTQVSRV